MRLADRKEGQLFKIPAPLPPVGEERLRPDVLIAALTYKLLKEAREVKKLLENVANTVTAAGEVFPVETPVYRDVREVRPGGRWRGVSIYNRGPSTCWVQLSKQMLAYKPVRLEPGASKSWFFPAPVIEAVYARSEEHSTLELEFTR